MFPHNNKSHEMDNRITEQYEVQFARMGYTRGIVVQYQYQGAGMGIVLVVVKNHLYPIPDQYQSFPLMQQSETKK